MTLSAFLRDYLYIPLGGSRLGKFNTYRNLFLTMLLGGIWHGAGWTFVVWGAWHGILLTINHGFRELLKLPNSRIVNSISWASTFMAVVIGWVFFRADSMVSAMKVLSAMVTYKPTEAADLAQISYIGLALVGVLVLPNSNELEKKFREDGFPLVAVLAIILLVSYTLFNLVYGQNDVYDFLYFDF